jgi:hypothetical protein
MNINYFLEKLNKTPQEITFLITIAVIEDNYNFSPTAFEKWVCYTMQQRKLSSYKILLS